MEATTRGGHERENEPRSRSAQMRGWGWQKGGGEGGGRRIQPSRQGTGGGRCHCPDPGKAIARRLPWARQAVLQGDKASVRVRSVSVSRWRTSSQRVGDHHRRVLGSRDCITRWSTSCCVGQSSTSLCSSSGRLADDASSRTR